MFRRPTHTSILSRVCSNFGLTAIALTTALHAVPTAIAQEARTVVIDHSDREAVNAPAALSGVSNQFKVIGSSYQVRAVTDLDGVATPATRPYFIFPLAAAGSGTVVSAEFRIAHPRASFADNADDTETMTLFSVDRFTSSDLRSLVTPLRADGTPATPFSQAALNNLQSIFDDLGDGRAYGTLTASEVNQGQLQTITLNATARQDLTAALNSGKTDFILAGDLTSLNTSGTPHIPGTQERIFRGSDESGNNPQPATQLILKIEGGSPSPAPALGGGLFGLAMLGTGFAGIGFARRRESSLS